MPLSALAAKVIEAIFIISGCCSRFLERNLPPIRMSRAMSPALAILSLSPLIIPFLMALLTAFGMYPPMSSEIPKNLPLPPSFQDFTKYSGSFIREALPDTGSIQSTSF
uniref:Uncharacterized protein n=1 Tax=uncultured marine virus TaxID=186617 RepID=A0A0F7L866_9VIRU|nr:hypothetical protein [uncultured marine virus]